MPEIACFYVVSPWKLYNEPLPIKTKPSLEHCTTRFENHGNYLKKKHNQLILFTLNKQKLKSTLK